MKTMLMKDYSNKKINFSNLSVQKINVFLEIIKEAQHPTLSYVAKKFKDVFVNFDDVLLFLLKAGLIEINRKQLRLKRNLSLDKKELTSSLLEAILKNPFYRESELEEFIRYFAMKNGQYWFYPDKKVRLKTSGVRNLLIDLGFLRYAKESDGYFISDIGLVYIAHVFNQRNLTPYGLSKKLESIEKLGAAAEVVILRYEKLRLKKFPKLASQIKHVSREKVNAGYDIQSYSVVPGGQPKHRYIEVKAVSELDYKFYWSRNELLISENFRNDYYLYLLPVKGNRNFKIKSLIIIQNPYKKVFKNKDQWKAEVELISFTMNK